METIITTAVQRGASDIHIRAGDVVRIRLNGKLVPLSKQPLTPEQTRAIALRLISSERDRERIDELQDYDASWGLAGVGRFRINIYRQRGSVSIVLRVIPAEVPTLEALGLPEVVARIAEAERGLVLVTGVTGSGKSSTMAAIVGFMNRTMERHIITMEDPIEFLHRNDRCAISQREVGSDTESFHNALRAALRQDPDAILIGEMRDTQTVSTAMKAAETGHLVISTLHTRDAAATVDRLVAMFSPSEQHNARIRLADALHAIVSQRLLPRKDGRGRALAAEVMLNTAAIRDCILDPDRLEELRDHIADGRHTYGMQTFDQSLAELVERDLVAFDVAQGAATNPNDFGLRQVLT